MKIQILTVVVIEGGAAEGNARNERLIAY